MKTKEEILKEYWPELQEGSIRKRILEAMQLYSDQQNKEKDAEIQRLTKEVEELKRKVEHRTGELVVKVEELTRLRELLGKATKQLQKIKKAPFGWHQETDQLLSEINALNHKP